MWTLEPVLGGVCEREQEEKKGVWTVSVLSGRKGCFSETQKLKEKLRGREDVVVPALMRASCAYVSFTDPAGAKLE